MAISKSFTSSFAELMDKRMMDIWMKNHPNGPPTEVRCYHCEQDPFSAEVLNTCPYCVGKGISAVPVSEI